MISSQFGPCSGHRRTAQRQLVHLSSRSSTNSLFGLFISRFAYSAASRLQHPSHMCYDPIWIVTEREVCALNIPPSPQRIKISNPALQHDAHKDHNIKFLDWQSRTKINSSANEGVKRKIEMDCRCMQRTQANRIMINVAMQQQVCTYEVQPQILTRNMTILRRCSIAT